MKTIQFSLRKSWPAWLAVLGLVLLISLPRLTALNQYVIVDEADRWRWANDFVLALNQGDLAGTLVGDGYPGIVPVWAETIWILIEAARRSLAEGQWIGGMGLSHLLHEWDRSTMLFQQRLPIVLLNIAIALTIVWAVWRLFGARVALVSGLLVALDPFYLSDSRVNRAEAVITGLMTLSMLFLIFYDQKRQFRYIVISGIFGGLSFLTKIQALVILPVVALTGLLIHAVSDSDRQDRMSLTFSRQMLLSLLKFGIGWVLAAGLTWFLLWPSMWVTPLETLTLVYEYATRKVGAEGVNLFFLGKTYLNADPGILFYPVVLLMRITPLVLLGLIGAAIRLAVYLRHIFGKKKGDALASDPFTIKGSSILVTYVVIYAIIMTLGSHKQDRYLMPVFLGLDILAAMGLVFMGLWLKNRFLASIQDSRLTSIEGVLLAVMVIVQTAIVLPHHPYYYSYFNPVFGGGPTAVGTLRVGWGEGMDQVGAYLAAKPNSRNLTVSSRFTHNMMLDFKGELIALGENDRWTRADYIVLYIQQIQRRLESERDFIDYFQAREPEKIITIGGIDYAWIYPIPFTRPANPQINLIPGQAALLGYSWETQPETGQPAIRLLWENLGIEDGRQLAARLAGDAVETEWAWCRPDSAFVAQAQTSGAYVESLCTPDVAALPTGHYTVEFGLASLPPETAVNVFPFPEGWQAARVTAPGKVMDTPEIERLEAIARQNVPAHAVQLDRVYDGRVRLAAYQLDPPQPQPGDTMELTLYWQAVQEISEPVQLTVQLADSRSLSLGRTDIGLPAQSKEIWFPGEVIITRHKFPLAADLDAPLAGRVEVKLKNQAEIPLQPTTVSGAKIDPDTVHFTISPDIWPAPDAALPESAIWQSGNQKDRIILHGFRISPAQPKPGDTLIVSLYWQTDQPVARDYVIFVHLLDDASQIVAQNDSLPRAGAYPTPWWLPGQIVEDIHPVTLPTDLLHGSYQVVVGLYRSPDGPRLLLADQQDKLLLGSFQIQ